MNNLGRRTINNGDVNKIVPADQVDSYLQKGWKLGGKSTRNSSPVLVPCKGGCGKFINKHDGKSGLCWNCLKASNFFRNQWQDDSYRDKVIKGVTGKKRSDAFKRNQSESMKRYYQEHPERRAQQGEMFRRSWAAGSHHTSTALSGNCAHIHSKAENMLFNALVTEFSDQYVKRCALRQSNDSRYVFPDVLLFNRIVLEYQGDYFHANPEVYSVDDHFTGGATMADIWMHDLLRCKYIERCDICKDLDAGCEYPTHIIDIIYIWENSTKHLMTQADWNTWVHARFMGWDELVST